jgi:hypothetical protein
MDGLKGVVMKQHKWHKEIKAWADGAEIESRYNDQYKKEWSEWELCREPDFHYFNYEFRIKPQPKEPQYLYAFNDNLGNTFVREHTARNKSETYIGKIKLEQDDDET